MAEKLVQELEMTRDNLERLMDMSECGMMVLGMQAEPEIIYANDCFYRTLQYSREDYGRRFGNSAMATVVPEEKQKVKALIARQSVAGGALHLEFRVNRKDGSTIWIAFTAKRDYKDKTGKMLYYCSCLDISRSKFHLEDAFCSKKELDLIANNIPGGVIKLRMSDFRILYANDGFYRLSGYSRAEYSMNFQDCCISLVHPDDFEMVRNTVETVVKNRGLLGMEYRIRAKKGETRWSYVNGTRIDDNHGDPVYLCVIVDITTRKMCEEELADNNRRSELITRMLKETLWTYDVEKKIIQRSGGLVSTYSPEALLEGPFNPERVKEFIHPEDVDRFLEVYQSWISCAGESRDLFRVRTDRGDYQRMEICTIAEAKKGETPFKIYGITRMVSDTVQPLILEEQVLEAAETNMEGKLLKMANSSQAESDDNITGLLPYANFLKKAERMIAERTDEDRYALVCADINEFRKFSHHYGFSISNQILKIFSDVLLTNLAKDGMCARVDGDYFVVLIQYSSHKELLRAMSAVVREQETMGKEDDCLKFGTTIGIYLVQREDHELLDMLEKADLARRSIKGLVGNHYAIYTEEVQQHKFHDANLLLEIRKAMAEDKVEICYLPRFQGNKESVVGCKAVPRIQLQNGQYMDFQQMMHLMERGGKLEDLGFYVLNEVARNMSSWKIRGNTVLPVSIEMSASQFSTTGSVEKIQEIVTRKNQLNPSDFIFEIPERYFADGSTVFEMAIKDLAESGCRIAISRFGADHTSLHAIRRLPISGIKFHGEYFIEHMVNSKDTIILQKIVEMAEELGMSVICGGINTKLQEDFAKKIGCGIFEGDMYYGAVRANVFEKCFLT